MEVAPTPALVHDNDDQNDDVYDVNEIYYDVMKYMIDYYYNISLYIYIYIYIYILYT